MDANVAAPPETRRRQWGSDKRVDPLAAVAPPASDALIAIGRIAIGFTVLAWLIYVFAYFVTGIINSSYQNNIDFLLETIVYVGITSVLALSALLYLVARQGALYRSRAHRRVPRAVIDDFFDTTLPTMTVLVPSYREEDRGGPQDPAVGGAAGVPVPAGGAVAGRSAEPDVGRAQGHPGRCPAALRRPDRMAGRTAGAVRRPRSSSSRCPNSMTIPNPTEAVIQIRALADEYAWAVDWLRMRMAAGGHQRPRRQVLRRAGARGAGRGLRPGRRGPDDAPPTSRAPSPRARMLQLHRRLAWTFRGELTWFERKLYSSLSQESNKAMNLNSYIGLMGHSFDVRETPGGSGAGARRSQRLAGDPGRRLPADPGCRQHHPARVLPAAGVRDVAAGEHQAGRHPDSVLGVPRLTHPDGAAVRCDHRPAAHRPSGDELLRRPPSGSAPTRSSASGRSTTSSRSSTRVASRSAAT